MIEHKLCYQWHLYVLINLYCLVILYGGIVVEKIVEVGAVGMVLQKDFLFDVNWSWLGCENDGCKDICMCIQ